MKGFFKYTFASILGFLLGFLLLIFILIGIFSSASAEKPVVVEPNTVLLIKFDSPIIDRASENPFEYINPMSFSPENRMGLDNILDNLKKAKEDENITGIILDLSLMPIGMASLHEIRDALIDFKTSGKFIYSYSDIYTHGSYYLASVSDKIFITPTGNLMFLGLSSEVIFYKGALDKLGIEIQVVRHGEFKGAVEKYIYKKLSAENRLQIQEYLNSLWGHMVEGIAEARNINVDEINRLADEMQITDAVSSLEHGFTDSLIYFDEFIDYVKVKTNIEESKDIKSISMEKYTKVPAKRETKGLIREKIAVVYAQGTIIDGDAVSGSIGGDAFAKAIRSARRDSSIKAIVLRINSGGGSGLASDIIWREVKLAAEVKPVIASMGDVAASGGYYIAAPANKIIASPNTITGSIGVFGMWPNAQEFVNDKLGITTEIVKTNDHADFGFMLEPLADDERAILQNEIEKFYKGFVERVAEGRAMTYEEVDKIAGGHVYSGSDALKLGLIDDFGGLKKAISLAAEEAGLAEYRIVKLPELEDPFQKILEDLTGKSQLKFLEKELGENYIYYQELKSIKELTGVQALMPFSLIVK
ncbi:MAG: signal peptide peptidase SppA [Bacteroidales bacterium]|nr:signal peptide peptidase SppA [Bacteroidales bacterium]MCF8389062.1 signal peptide peptidase SppA [Bacteroidales bacterium]